MKSGFSSFRPRPLPWLARLALAIAVAPCPATAAEEGRPWWREVTAAELPTPHPFSRVAVAADGMIYLAAPGRILEWDGHRVREISLGLGEGPLLSQLATRGRDELFFATSNEAGALRRNATDGWSRSMLAEPAGPARPVRRVLGLAVGTEDACVVRLTQVAVWRDGQWVDLPLPGGAEVRACASDGRACYVQTTRNELLRVGRAGLEPVARLDPGDASPLLSCDRLADGRLRLVFGSGAVVAWRASDGRTEQLWSAPVANAAVPLAGSGLALVAPDMNVGVFAPDGRRLTSLDLDAGFNTLSQRQLARGADGRLWLASGSTLYAIDGLPAATFFSQPSGLRGGRVWTMARHEGVLHFATDDGVFRLESPATAGAARIHRVEGLEGRAADFAAVHGSLLAAARDGIYELRQGVFVRIVASATPINVLAAIPETPFVYFGIRSGLGRLQRVADGWKDEGVHSVTGDLRSLARGPGEAMWLGDPSRRVTLATPGQPLAAAIKSKGMLTVRSGRRPGMFPQSLEMDVFSSGEKLPPDVGRLQILRWNDDTYIAAESGLLRYDAATRRFAPVPGLEWLRGFRLHLLAPAPGQKAWVVLRPAVDEGGAPWRVAEMARDGRLIRQLPASVLSPAREIDSLYQETTAESGHVLWVGTRDGVIRIALDLLPPAPPPPRVILLPAVATIPAGAGNLRFEFAAPDAAGSVVAYQTRLGGPDAPWQEFSRQPWRELARPGPGRNVFAVRARGPDGVVGPATTFAFTVLPPWWLTPWAYGGYVCAGLAGVAGILRWRLGSVRRRNAELERVVAERTENLRTSEQQLLVAKEAAESANRAKSAFLANMSHELRTPLNAVLGYAQILRRETGLSEKGRHQLGIVGRNGEHLLQMINEVLDLAKIEAGKMTLHPVGFPLTRVLKTAADLFEQRAADKGLAFRLELGAGLPKAVSADEAKLRQVLFNLLGNAVKFTEQGEVTLRVSLGGRRTDGGWQTTEGGDQADLSAVRPLPSAVRPLLFEVRDTGPGIAPDQLQAIFEPFHQTAPSPGGLPGTGLGLPISQRIVELLGGTIRVESDVGRGSRFWFEIALPEVAPAAPRPATIRTITGYEGPRRRLLVVDDEATNRAVLRDLLESVGFAVDEAADGAACLAAVGAHPPDALLIDLRMPVLGGLDVVARLRERPATAALPIIAVSASVLGFDQHEALAAGCDAFLAKPVQETQLLDTLGRTLRLVWQWRESATPFESVRPFADGGEPPDAAQLDALTLLARGGDLDAFRDYIARALAEGSPAAVFLRELAALAAGFKTAEIRQRLAEARARHPAGIAPS